MAGTSESGGVAQSISEAIIRLRWVIIVVCLAVTLVCGLGMRFHVDEATGKPVVETDSRVYFGPDNPDLIALESLEATFTKDNNLLVVLAPKNGNIFTRETLALVEDLTEQAWQTPYSRRVDSVTNYQHSYAEGDDLIISDLVSGAADLTDEDLERVREIANAQVELYRKIVSEKGDVTAVNITVLNPGESLNEIPDIVNFVRDLASKTRAAHPEVDVYLTGGVMTDMAFADASEEDSKTLIPAMLGLVVLIVGVALRMVVGTLVTIVVIAMTVLTTMGLTGWAGLIINSSTTIAPVIVMTLTVAHSVHLLAALRYNMGDGMEKRAALIEALRVNLEPIAITSLTTAVGFLSLNFSESPPLRELGNVVAVGMVLAFLYSILFTPAAMAILPSRSKAKASTGKSAMDRLADVVVAKQKPLLYGCTATVLIAMGGITQIELDDDFFRYFDHRYDFRVHSDFTMDKLTGLHMIEYSLPSGEEQGILQPDYLKKLDEFAEWYRQSEKVVHVSAITDTIKRLNRTLHANDESYYSIPDTSDEAAQYLMLYELSVPYGLDLNSQMDVGKSASRMTITLVDVKASEVLDLARAGEAWLKENAPGIWEAAGGNPVRATGMSVAVSTISAHNIQSMLGGTFLALCLISLLLLFIFRNVRIAIISLVPNLTPAAIAFGIWGYLFGEVNLAISVVIAMTLGIVVDDTVHLLSKYLRARREHGEDREGAVRYALHTVGMPLWVTTVALVVGFGVLATSGFAVNGDMGLLSAITIAVALIADFLLLPPILMQFDRRTMT